MRLGLRFVRHFLLCLQFFTRIPLTGRLAQWVGYSPTMLRDCVGHFPGIGLLVGLLVAGLAALLLLYLPPSYSAVLVAVALSTAFGALLTGAFHEDGLADVADGLGGSQDRQRAMEIMKDSRIGVFGAIALLLALLCKLSLLALLGEVSAPLLVSALVLAHVVSRTWPLLTMRLLAHVGDAERSKSKPIAQEIGLNALLSGWSWCLIAFGLFYMLQSAADWIDIEPGVLLQALLQAVLASALAWAVLTRWFWLRLGGFTGDCLGATQQLCELAFYLGLALGL